MRRLFFLGLFVVGIVSPRQGQLPGQSPQSRNTSHRPEFEVASIRENKSGGQATSNFPLDRGNTYAATGGIFLAKNQSFVTLLIFAYKINIGEFRGGLLRSLPGWAIRDTFDVAAKAESQNATKEDMRLMMQTLLENRFKLRVHRETRTMVVSALYMIKPGLIGPLLKHHDAKSSCSKPLTPVAVGAPISQILGSWPATCGDGAEVQPSRSRLREGGRDMTMNAIADWLDGTADSDRPISNETGLNGAFDFVMEFDPESIGRDSVGIAPRDDLSPTFIEAIEEQLGLRFRKDMGTIKIFVVDNVEYPSSN